MTKQANADFAICTMCGRQYGLDGSVAGVLGQLAPGEDVDDPGGTDVEVDLCGLPVSAMFVGADSAVREQGFDVLFLVCSQECVTAIRLAAELDASSGGRDVDPAAAGVYWLRLWRPERLMTARSLEQLELFESRLRVLAPHVARRIGCDRPTPGAAPHATSEHHASLQERLGHTCAWCLHTIGTRGQRLPVWTRNHDDPVVDGHIAVFKVGERIVAAQRIEPESPESADAVFLLCSRRCASDLSAAMADDRRLRVVH
jgi:hypothetical protein